MKEVINLNRNDNSYLKYYLGNFYDRNDGYDGATFLPKGIGKTITRSVGGIMDIMIINKVICNEESGNSCNERA